MMEEISREVYYNMQKYSKLVISTISDIIANFEKYTSYDITEKQYQINNTLEVINPILIDDINILNQVSSFLDSLVDSNKLIL